MTTMLPYIGTKNVLARPMTRGAYNEYQGWIIPHDQDPEDEGYLVEYLDGGKGNHPKHENYISWSPKDVFERSYVQQPTSQRGNIAEMVHLDESPFLPQSINQRIFHIELDPNDSAGKEHAERMKALIKSGGSLMTEPRGLIAGLPMVDEASFYPNGAPMSIYKTKLLDNGMMLGTVEQLSNVNGQLDFSDALRALKFGYRVQRSGWNAKDQWLAVSNPESAVVDAANFWSPHSRAYAERNGGSAVVPPCILIKNAQGEIQMGWAPSPGDMFANDWVVIEEVEETK